MNSSFFATRKGSIIAGKCFGVTRFTTNQGRRQQHQQQEGRIRRNLKRFTTVIGITSFFSGVCIYTRWWREKHIDDVQLASASGAFVTGAPLEWTAFRADIGNEGVGKQRGRRRRRRNLRVLASTVSRAGLMGTSIPGAKSVKAELESIRKWHQERGFSGGLTLRELTQPLYDGEVEEEEDGEIRRNDQGDVMEGGDDVEMIPGNLLNQRECYYLYYEIMGNGEIKQQIFCRGTTLGADVATCLKSVFVYDTELGCKLHLGFRDHADRLLADVEPLLAPPGVKRATVEICGHSLGGAVAYIVAMKLRKRGYNVIRVTSVGAPRFCSKDAVEALRPLLPKDSIRIEDDCDPVPYLPPFGANVGDKLWFVSKMSGEEFARFVPFQSSDEDDQRWWVESVFVNLKLPETLKKMKRTHRVSNYVSKIQQLESEMEQLSASDGENSSDNSPHEITVNKPLK